MTGAAKRVVLEVVGWVLLLAGVAALVLPGPGLLLMASGLAILSQQYTWAERLLEPVLLRALRAAAEGVETWPRILMSTAGALALGGLGALWLVGPDTPSWWPVADKWWLVGGPWTGVTLVLSSLIALGLLVYSYRRFHGKPEARAALESQIEEADEDAHEQRDRLRRREPHEREEQ
ncbi:putative transmembrane protein PGPGW [Nocardioides sp. J9]|uniref:PGPGW domain-containing protein n=1 Tax=Nocardioides sp. J9 TaxID=935844 RepID=UPI0011A2F015|nr:PGPGW domain-containing protein [Nocardioides sp. J9]TWG90042.1 putative transmembrane protein PGPGW [Nocardioides sp. J9]